MVANWLKIVSHLNGLIIVNIVPIIIIGYGITLKKQSDMTIVNSMIMQIKWLIV